MTVITNTEDYLGAGQIRDRIAELQAGLDSWAVKRARNESVIARRPTKELAVKYIDEEDYDPGRVVAVYDPDGATYPAELTALLKLDNSAADVIPFWEDNLAAIVRASVIDDDYARDLFRSRSADVNTREDLDEWPYCYIDWQVAAGAIGERRAKVDFGGVVYCQAVD